MSWNYQNSLPRAPIIKMHVIWKQTDYFLCDGAFSALRWRNFIEKRNKFYDVNITYDCVTDFMHAEPT